MVLFQSVQTFTKQTCIHISSLLIDTTTCGMTKGECDQMKSPPLPDTDSSIVRPVILGFLLLFFVLTCFCFGISYIVRKIMSPQRRNTRIYTPPIPQSQYPYRQQFVQQPGHLQRVVPSINRSVYTNAATPIYNNDEQLPPSYEVVIRDTRFMYPPPSAAIKDIL